MPEVIQKTSKKRGKKVTQEMLNNLKNAKQYLQRGELKLIAEEVGVGNQAVTDVLAGKFVNYEIIAKIFERAEKNKAILARGESI